MKRIVKQEDMHRVAKYLVNNHQSPCLILLDGEMGSGKTFLCQEIIKLMIPDVIVTSPTFNLLQIYQNNNYLIYHYDLYRLDSDMIYELDIEHGLNNAFCLVEWHQNANSFFQKFHHTLVSIKIIDPNAREVVIEMFDANL